MGENSNWPANAVHEPLKTVEFFVKKTWLTSKTNFPVHIWTGRFNGSLTALYFRLIYYDWTRFEAGSWLNRLNQLVRCDFHNIGFRCIKEFFLYVQSSKIRYMTLMKFNSIVFISGSWENINCWRSWSQLCINNFNLEKCIYGIWCLCFSTYWLIVILLFAMGLDAYILYDYNVGVISTPPAAVNLFLTGIGIWLLILKLRVCISGSFVRVVNLILVNQRALLNYLLSWCFELFFLAYFEKFYIFPNPNLILVNQHALINYLHTWCLSYSCFLASYEK